MKCISKIVVFDLDETLGYFMELGMFWDSLTNYIKNNKLQIPIDQKLFNKILDLYPEFLRPNIIGILKFPLPQHGSNIDNSFFSHKLLGILLIISLIHPIGVGSSLVDL